MLRFLAFIIFISNLLACTPSGTRIPVATLTLVPPTATAFLPTPSVTNTPANLLQPSQLNATSTPKIAQPILTSAVTLEPSFVETLITDLATYLNITDDQIRLVSVETEQWQRQKLGCDKPDSPIASIEGYRVLFLVGSAVYEYHTNGQTEFERCQTTTAVHGELLISVDPIASELVVLAQKRVAQTLDLPLRRIQLVDVVPYTWRDTSLGCPAKDQQYTATIVDGYRVVLQAGDTLYAFHTDSERLYPCESGNEQLPN